MFLLIYSLSLYTNATSGQETKHLTIDSCYSLARKNYPLLKQMELIETTRDYSLNNASKGYLPQLIIAGQSTYQSDVTRLPITIPHMDFPATGKDQYKLYGEIIQPITDLFTMRDQRDLIKSNAGADEQKTEMELFKLRERVNQLYFGILLIDARIQQTELFKKDVQAGIDKSKAAIANGIALKSTVDILKVEMLKVQQQLIELKSNRKSYSDVLSVFINDSIDDSFVFELPVLLPLEIVIKRPELKWYDLQHRTLDIQRKLIADKNLPRFNLFFQGGYGRPALNALDNDFSTYYIGGLRLNWNLSGFYTFNKERKILSLNQKSINAQKETFLFNTNLILKQQASELIKWQELISSDAEIIQLHETIKLVTKNQLENGTATPIDYLTTINAEDQARQNLAVHQIQLLMSHYNYLATSGN